VPSPLSPAYDFGTRRPASSWQVPTPDGYSWAIGAASAANGVVYRPAQRRLKADAVRPYPRAGLAR